jgi:predicted metalloprotease with PDZ domain
MPISTVKDVPGPPEPPKTCQRAQSAARELADLLVISVRMFSAGKLLFVTCAVICFAIFVPLQAQTLEVRISVASTAPARIKIDARLPYDANTLSFRNAYGGVLGLGERIEAVEGIRTSGASVRGEKLAPGEFRLPEKLARFVYEVNLAGPLRPADLSRVSSLNSDYGVLMMADLLPHSTGAGGRFASTAFKIDVPGGWSVFSNIKSEGSQVSTHDFSTEDPDTAVFLVGSSLHKKRQQFPAADFSVVASGEWSFSDNDATKLAGKILQEYSRITRFELKREAVLMLIPYPGDAGPENWSAETRGNVTVLAFGRKGNRKNSLLRLGIALSHELFHLWVPNSLKLEGDYDWFFEGFTLYQALRMDLQLGFISFDAYLQTIAGVYDSYRSAPDRDRLSLIEESQRRWTTSSSAVYVKGMLLAFIYDLSVRKNTNCAASLDDVYTELFRLSATGQESANETIIGLLGAREGLKTFGQDYVERVAKIDLETILPAYGIQMGSSGSGATKLALGRNLSETQRYLLGCIGYRK